MVASELPTDSAESSLKVNQVFRCSDEQLRKSPCLKKLCSYYVECTVVLYTYISLIARCKMLAVLFFPLPFTFVTGWNSRPEHFQKLWYRATVLYLYGLHLLHIDQSNGICNNQYSLLGMFSKIFNGLMF